MYNAIIHGKTSSIYKISIGLIPVRPISFRPFPFRLNFSRFAHSFFRPFQLRPFPIPPHCRFTHFFFFRPGAISPNFPISPNDHFALFPQGPFPFCPNAIFLISGPKANKKFSINLISHFRTLFLGLLWIAHIIGEEDIWVTLCFFHLFGYSYDDAYFWEFLGI